MWAAINYSSEEEKEKGNQGSNLVSFNTAKIKLAYCRDCMRLHEALREFGSEELSLSSCA